MAQAVFTQAFDAGYGPFNPLNDGGEGRPDWLEAASQSFKNGDPVYFASGKITVAVAGSNLVDALLGFARNNATGVTDTPVLVRAILDGDVFVMNYKPSGGGSQATAQTLLGTLTNFDIHTTGSVNYLVANPTGAARTKPWGIIEHVWTKANGYQRSEEVIGDLNGHVVVRMSRYLMQ